jgi:hypothetical protein
MSQTLRHVPHARQGYAVATPVRHRSGVRAPMLLVVSFAVAAPASILVAAAGGAHAQVTALVVLGALAFVVGWTADLLASVVVGLVFWLCFDGFDADRWGALGLHGHDALTGLVALVAAGVLGGLLGAWSRAWSESHQGSNR